MLSTAHLPDSLTPERRAYRPVVSGPVFVGIAMALYTAVMFFFSYWRHLTSALGDNDYTVFDQSMWTTYRYGMLMVNGIEGGTHFAVHNSPIFLLLQPLYALWPGIPLLLLLQTLALAAGAWAVYLMARERLPEWGSRVFVVLYLFYHPLHGVNYDQLNESAYATAPWLFALYFLSKRRWRAFWVCCVLALMVKEDEAFTLAVFGLYVIGSGLWMRQVLKRGESAWMRGLQPEDAETFLRHGFAMVALAMAYAGFSFGVVLPHFQAETGFGYFIAERYGNLGRTLPQVIHTMVFHPAYVFRTLLTKDRIGYVPDMLAPFAFLSLLTPAILLISLPAFTINLLSNFEMMHNSASRYPAAIIPFVVVSAIATVSRMRPERQEAALKACLFLCLGFSLLATPSPPRVGFHLAPYDAHQRMMLRVAHSIPEFLSVSSQSDILQHACHRRVAQIGFKEGADVVLADSSRAKWYHEAKFDTVVPALLGSRQYRMLFERDGLQVLVRNGVTFSVPQ